MMNAEQRIEQIFSELLTSLKSTEDRLSKMEARLSKLETIAEQLVDVIEGTEPDPG